jgi:hypothetical protein
MKPGHAEKHRFKPAAGKITLAKERKCEIVPGPLLSCGAVPDGRAVSNGHAVLDGGGLLAGGAVLDGRAVLDGGGLLAGGEPSPVCRILASLGK